MRLVWSLFIAYLCCSLYFLPVNMRYLSGQWKHRNTPYNIWTPTEIHTPVGVNIYDVLMDDEQNNYGGRRATPFDNDNHFILVRRTCITNFNVIVHNIDIKLVIITKQNNQSTNINIDRGGGWAGGCGGGGGGGGGGVGGGVWGGGGGVFRLVRRCYMVFFAIYLGLGLLRLLTFPGKVSRRQFDPLYQTAFSFDLLLLEERHSSLEWS